MNWHNINPSDPNDYQHVQDKILDVKKRTKDANNLYMQMYKYYGPLKYFAPLNHNGELQKSCFCLAIDENS